MSTILAVLIGLATMMNNPQIENLSPTLKEPIDITVVQPELELPIRILIEIEHLVIISEGRSNDAKIYRDLSLSIIDGQEEAKSLLASKKSQLQWDIGNIDRLQRYGVKQEI